MIQGLKPLARLQRSHELLPAAMMFVCGEFTAHKSGYRTDYQIGIFTKAAR
jgi:hypothetical protein